MANRRSMEDERSDARDAFQKASLYHAELDEIYRYFAPWRQSTNQRAPDGNGRSEGNSRTDHLFDGTGLSAAFNFSGNMVADWMPPFQDFFKIEAGPLVPADQREQLNRLYTNTTAIAHAVLPKVRVQAHELFADLFAGTGAMCLSKGTEREPVRAFVAPINEIALEEGPFGDVWSIWWKRNYKAKHLEAAWPEGKFSAQMAKRIRDDRNSDVLVTQSTRYNPVEDKWTLRVYAEGDEADAEIFTEDYRVSPWMVPRFFKVPGESHGRGLAHMGLPFAKSGNKVRELSLRAAAFALMGIWMRRNDGVFNPNSAVFKPLAMWTVASTGGPLGATLQKLPVPDNFDVSMFVQKDEREQLNKVLLNDELPELQDSVRSPTEIAARLRKVAKNKGGAGSRIAMELISPMVQRTVDILELSRLLPSNVRIDHMLTRATITAPAAAAQRADRVGWAVDWLQMMLGLFGPQAALVAAKVEELLPEIGRWMGVDETFIRNKAEQKEFQDMIKALVSQQQQAEAASKQKPQPPGQQFMNGGM